MDFSHKKFCIFLCKTYILSILICILSLFLIPTLYYVSIYLIYNLLESFILTIFIATIELLLSSYLFYKNFDFLFKIIYLFLGKYKVSKETILDKYESVKIENKIDYNYYIRTKNFSNVLIFTEWQYRFFCKKDTDIYVICPKKRDYQIFGVPNCYID